MEDVAALGRVDILKHGRLVAVVMSPRALQDALAARAPEDRAKPWGEKHMIPQEHARSARMLNAPSSFDEE